MESRRTLRNWNAFGSVERLLNQFMLTDLFDPVLKLGLNIFGAVVLCFTLVLQLIRLIVSVDILAVAAFQAACAQLSRVFSIIVLFSASERERVAAINSIIKFYANVLWVGLVYKAHPDSWQFMSAGPRFAIATMQLLVGLYTERLTTDTGTVTQAMYSIFLFSLFLMVCNTIARVPTYMLMEVLLFLRSPFDTLCIAVNTIFKVCGYENNMPLYISQIVRYSFWSSVHLILLVIAFTHSKASNGSPYSRPDRFLYLALFMHDVADLLVPLRQFLLHSLHEYFVAKTFPRLTTEELGQVSSEVCSVCLCEHSTSTVRLRCSHLLHAHCLQRILQQSAEARNPALCRCPMCRTQIETPQPATAGRTGSRDGSTSRSALGGLGMRGAGQDSPYLQLLGLANVTQFQQGQHRRGLLSVEERALLQRLNGHNLQHGDVIHIRIIPRNAQRNAAENQSAMAVAASDASISTGENVASSAVSTSTGSDQEVGDTEPVQPDRINSPPTPRVAMYGDGVGRRRNQASVGLRRAPSSGVDLDNLSTLRGIHGGGLESNMSSSSNLLSSERARKGEGVARINLRDSALSSLSLRELVAKVRADEEIVSQETSMGRRTRAAARAAGTKSAISSPALSRSGVSGTPPLLAPQNFTHQTNSTIQDAALLSLSSVTRKRKLPFASPQTGGECAELLSTRTESGGGNATHSGGDDEETVCSVASTAHSQASSVVTGRVLPSPSQRNQNHSNVSAEEVLTGDEQVSAADLRKGIVTGQKRPWCMVENDGVNLRSFAARHAHRRIETGEHVASTTQVSSDSDSEKSCKGKQ